MNEENIYWLFSSAAQAVATFVAFLLAGYTLVHTMMDSLQQRDDTLAEIHSTLIRQYYQQIKTLAIITGAAILSSLAMLYLNGLDLPYKVAIMGGVAALDTAAIILGIAFVIRIIDPDKYTNAAKRLIAEEEQTQDIGPSAQADSEDFFALFGQLEDAIRGTLEQAPAPRRASLRTRDDVSYRDMLHDLYKRELIDRSMFIQLMHIGRYRNLAYYGNLPSVNSAIIGQTRAALARIQAIPQTARRGAP